MVRDLSAGRRPHPRHRGFYASAPEGEALVLTDCAWRSYVDLDPDPAIADTLRAPCPRCGGEVVVSAQ